MEESGVENNPGDIFSYLRRKFEPKIREAHGVLVKYGMNPDAPGFSRVRKGVAKTIVEKEKEADIDELTQVYNLRGFEKKLQEAVERVKRVGEETIVISLDGNGVKKINDEKGHDAGNKYIMDTAKCLSESSRLLDTVARCGGDEFIVLLTNTNVEGAQKWWDRVNKNFEERSIKISAGFSILNHKDPTESLKRADEAMYEAKGMYYKEMNQGRLPSNHLVSAQAQEHV